MTQAVCTKLPDRAFITVSGADTKTFLQGLITQDISLLDTVPLIYTCLLTPNGKFLFDFFIFEDGDHMVIDCEGSDRLHALYKRLSMYKLRSDVKLEIHDHLDVWQVFNGTCDTCMKDPRFDGYRAYFAHPFEVDEVPFDTWDEYRIAAEIPDGSRDLIPEKSFVHESAVVTQSAVSYTKGCYMGQELVSRMHHRGLVKKQLRCVDINALPDGAKLRSSCNETGLALVKI